MPHFSFRIKMLLLYIGLVLMTVFIVFATGSYYINKLQRGNVEDAVALAQDQARRMAREILEMAAAQQATDLSQPGMQAGLKAITSISVRMNKSVVWAAVIDAKGNRVEQYRPDMPGNVEMVPHSAGGKASVSRLQTPGGAEIEIEAQSESLGESHEVSEPLIHEGHRVGEVRLKITEDPRYQRIEASSQNITEALFIGCGVLLIFLLVIFYVLWRLFARQVELVQQSEKLDRMAYVGTLASGLAHEIRNPLSAMSVNLEVMREELAEGGSSEASGDTSARAADLASRVQREVRQLNMTLTSFLDFALPRKEGLSEFSLRGMLEELVELHAEQMKQHSISYELLAPSHDEATVQADRLLIHQAFRNILVNAIQILESAVKRHLRIKVERRGHSVVTTFSDTGPGIAEENFGRIFEVFFSTRKGGSGFGLAITRKVVEEHGGSIRAYNNDQALGATFEVVLPRKGMSEVEILDRRGRFSRLIQGGARLSDSRG